MAKITWDDTGKRYFETGVDHGVLYPYNTAQSKYDKGVAWNGLTSVSESPEGAEPTDFWADNIKYASLLSAETFNATIEAYTYPKEFEACDGTATLTEGMTVGQQDRQAFGFSYRTIKQNDVGKVSYKIHLIYGCTASPSEKAYETVNDSPDAITFSWEITTNPVNVANHKPTSCVVIDTELLNATQLEALEKKLYGDEAEGDAELPTPDELKTLLETNKGE